MTNLKTWIIICLWKTWIRLLKLKRNLILPVGLCTELAEQADREERVMPCCCSPTNKLPTSSSSPNMKRYFSIVFLSVGIILQSHLFFIQVILKEIKVKSTTVQKAEELRQKIQRIVCTDRFLFFSYKKCSNSCRGILEAGSKAFVTHIESYVKHDCNIVCSLKG